MINRQWPPSEALLAECLDWVGSDAATNNLPISLLHRALRDVHFKDSLYLIAARGPAGIVALASRSDYPKMGLAAGDDLDAVGEIAHSVRQDMPDLPCIMGPAMPARRFVEAWHRPGEPEPTPGLHSSSTDWTGSFRTRPFRDSSSSPPSRTCLWLSRFAAEARQPPHDMEETAHRRIREESLFIWSDGEPVCWWAQEVRPDWSRASALSIRRQRDGGEDMQVLR